MLQTLIISIKLQITYWTNSRLYSLKQIPGIRRLLSDRLYGFKGLKVVLMFFGTVREFIMTVFKKLAYMFFMVGLAVIAINGGLFSLLVEEELELSGSAEFYWVEGLHVLLFLTIAGAVLNNDFFDGSVDKHYAINLLKFDARSYTLTNYAYLLFKYFIGFLPVCLLLTVLFDKSVLYALLVPLYVVCAKLCFASIETAAFKRNRRTLVHRIKSTTTLQSSESRKIAKKKKAAQTDWREYTINILAVLALPCAYVPLFFRRTLTAEFSVISMLIIIAAGIVSIIRIIRFDEYDAFCRTKLAEFFEAQINLQNLTSEIALTRISSTNDSKSDKSGFEFLNEIFVKRHRSILWKRSVRYAVIILCVAAAAALGIILPFSRSAVATVINSVIPRSLTALPMLLYFINHGEHFTQCMFMNCDHSLLSYPFYKEPSNILKLFKLRLFEITKVNLLPAFAISCSLVLLLALSGGTGRPLYYPLIFFSPLLISAFFSVHYLVMYYLLQPYSSGTEVVSAPYRIVMVMTYFPCYMVFNIGNNTDSYTFPITFGIFVILFSAAYSLIALLLAYRLAPRTFKIRV